MLPRLILLTALLLGSPHSLPAAEAPLPVGLRALLATYPQQLCGARPDLLLWCDGTVMAWDDGKVKSLSERLEEADLEDQFALPYPAGPDYPIPPPAGFDPGRSRHEPFFRKMYGADRSEVEKNLASVAWPFGTQPTRLQVTRTNGVDQRLRRIIDELQGLPTPLREILAEPAGGYFWRPIAGTSRLSLHSFGIAVDLGGRFADYWRWDAEKSGGSFPWRNRIPWEIVEIFERHGFIWGGKWHHYDSMHFEYRPELLMALP
ncbi:MAG: M15 family metallopeptidase [Desulfuromonadales bacterium]|nr:M15 family metallopeptidase [Desulfuromonadales bacterium]